MTLAFLLLAVALVFAVAAVAVGRASVQLGHEPYRPRFDLTQAVAFVAEALPNEEANELSHADVERLITWHLEDLRDLGVALAEGEPAGDARATVVDAAGVRRLQERARAEDRSYGEAEIRAVIAAELAYLEAIGAVGRPIDDGGSSPNGGGA